MPEILSIGELLDLGNSAATAGLIPYSALEYSQTGSITGISGSSIAGGVDSAAVSSIVSGMVSGKADKSALDDCCSAMSSVVNAKADKSALDDCCSAMSSVVSAKMDKSESSSFYSTANESGFITIEDVGTTFVYNSAYSSFSGDVVNNISNISSTVSGLTGDYLEKSASSMFAPSGSYAYNSSLSSYIPFSSVSGTNSKISAINGSAIAGSVDSSVVSSIVSSYVASGVSGKADKSALDNCCSAMSAVVSAKANTSALTSYVPYSALKNGPTTATISAIGNSAVYDNSAHARVNTLSTSRIPYSALEYSAGTNTITGISGSAIAGQSFTPSQLQLVVDSGNMTAASVGTGIKIGVKVPVVIVSNSSQATAANVVYVVTG